jgi:hypothetical protein
MRRNTLIKQEFTIICEENGPINLIYNVLLTTLKVNIMVKPTVHVVTTKSTLTCTNCGKISHFIETCHNRKIEVPVVPTTTIKSIELIARTKTQTIKSRKIHVHYPYIIFLM